MSTWARIGIGLAVWVAVSIPVGFLLAKCIASQDEHYYQVDDDEQDTP